MMKDIEIKTVPFMCEIPAATVGLKMTAKVFLNGKVCECVSEVDIEEIRKGMIVGEEYEDANAIYVLTDEAKKELGLDE